MKSETEIAQWRIKYLTEHKSDLSESDLTWVIRIEESLQRQGYLSSRQSEVLENIYSKY